MGVSIFSIEGQRATSKVGHLRGISLIFMISKWVNHEQPPFESYFLSTKHLSAPSSPVQEKNPIIPARLLRRQMRSGAWTTVGWFYYPVVNMQFNLWTSMVFPGTWSRNGGFPISHCLSELPTWKRRKICGLSPDFAMIFQLITKEWVVVYQFFYLCTYVHDCTCI